MPDQIRSLAEKIQQDPQMIEVGRVHTPVEKIDQHIFPVGKSQKMEILLHMLDKQQMHSVLVFSRTKRGADKISRRLGKSGVKAETIHSDRSQSQRTRTLDGFRDGKFQVLVATDIAARGIDVEGISHVVNYDVPTYAEDYVHRIGRTGRAQAGGEAITLVSGEEIKHLRKIERFTGLEFKPRQCEDFEYSTTVTIPSKAAEKRAQAVKRVRRSRGRSRGRRLPRR
jgi:ATP-dependent RNA helicase RhlE